MKKKLPARNSSAGQDFLHAFDNYSVPCAKAIAQAKKKNRRKQWMKTGKGSRFFLDLVILNHWWLPKEKNAIEKKRKKKKKELHA